MSSTIQDRVLAATITCLRPLARVLLRSGIGYRQFSEAAKNAFVEEAANERDARGRYANTSRIAVRTGLSRKEVARLRILQSQRTEAVDDLVHEIRNLGYAARTLQVWYTDARFLNSSGEPKELPFSEDSVSFSSLVRAVGGDVPAGAVRAELLAADAIVELTSGHLKATKRFFVPGSANEDVVVGLTQIVFPVIEGLARNTGREVTYPFVQRFSYSDELDPTSIAVFRQMASGRCADFIQSIDDWLIAREAGAAPNVGMRKRVGVGVFYFEGSAPGESNG